MSERYRRWLGHYYAAFLCILLPLAAFTVAVGDWLAALNVPATLIFAWIAWA